MKIGLITRHLDLSVGYGTVARNLLPALGRAGRGHQYYLYTPRRPRAPVPEGFTVRSASVPGRRSALVRWEHVAAPRAAVKDGVDLIHYLHLAAPLPPTGRPVITNVLDAILWAEPGYRLPRAYDLLARRDIKVASHLITISEAAKADLHRLRHVPSDKITVTELGTPPRPPGKPSRAATAYAAGRPFLLFVGGTERRKNLRTVLQALGQIEPMPRLAVVGPTDPSPIHDHPGDLLALLSPSQRRQVRFFGRVSDADLDRLYRRARAVLFPSRYEGFGLPVLEPMSRGTPVITSNVSSLPEVAGSAAVQLDPDDADAMADTIRTLWSDSRLRNRLAKAGRAQAARFTWERTARKTLAVYAKLGSR